MATRKENLKSLFTNTRSRIIILFTAAVLIIAVVIGYTRLHGLGGSTNQSKASLRQTPAAISSIPGALNQTEEYAKLQSQENVLQAQRAQKTGSSAIPTIIRTQKLGAGVNVIGAQGGTGGVGFETLKMQQNGGTEKSLWLSDLQKSSCSTAKVQEVLNQGANMSFIRQACSCAQLKDDGFALQDLRPVCTCKDLRSAGFNARQFKDAGYTAVELRRCGLSACEMKSAGFTAQEMKDAGYTDGELKGAGFSDKAIRAATGLPPGITEEAVRNAGCTPEALQKLKKAGVSAAAIRRITGCSAEQLKAAGYSAKELADAGFSAAQLKNAGFNEKQLKAAGFSARDLMNAGFTPKQLAEAGYTPEQIQAAENELPPGISAEAVRNAGCDVDALSEEKAAGVSAKLIRRYAKCSAQSLKAAGFDDKDLANAGFSPEEIKNAAVPNDAMIRSAGCDPTKLNKLRQQGVSAKRIRTINNCSASALRSAGFGSGALSAAGFTPKELQDAGFTANQLREAGLKPATVIANGRVADCSAAALEKAREAGISARAIKDTLGCSAAALKNAGYTAKQLKNAGFSAAELKNAGFTPQQLKEAGYTAGDLKAAGFSAKDLKDAGYTAAELKNAGFSAKALKDAGFTAGALKNAGFSAKDLKDAGFTAADLKNAGFSAKDLKEAGFAAKALKDAGFSAQALSDAGYSRQALKKAGFSDQALEEAGLEAPGSSMAGLGDASAPASGSSDIAGIPGSQGQSAAAKTADSSQKQLQKILSQQAQERNEQRYQQQIKQRAADMGSAANQAIQQWKQVSSQSYIAGQEQKAASQNSENSQSSAGGRGSAIANAGNVQGASQQKQAIVKTGDILFAVLDTSVNSDQPSPILATIVSGKLKGSKLIGSFTLPPNGDKMIISFNTLSSPGAPRTISINAYAIDPETARTALSSRTDHHYLERYGSLFASSFLEGFGNAFQSANTTVTIGGTGGGDNVTVSNGVGRSAMENAVIGLATVGKAWGQQVQQLINRPTTIEVYSGTGIGVLFTQDLTSL